MSVTIGIDARPLCDPGSDAHAYTLHLVHALAYRKPDLAFHLFVDREPDAELLPRSDRFAVSLLRAHPSLWKPSALAPAAQRAGCRLLHVQGTLPVASPVPVVTTVRHLGPIDRPEAHPRTVAWAWRHLLPRQIGRAAAVITCSETTAAELRGRLGVAEVVVTPYGVEPAYRPQCESVQTAALRLVELPARFVLGRARGGGAEAVKAVWERARREHGLDLELVIEGDAPAGIRAIHELESRLGPAVLSAARAVILGAPGEPTALALLEAMASGTPAVGPGDPLLAEIGGPAVSLGDESAQAAALATLVTDEAERRKRMIQGLARAQQRTWPGMAEATVAVYQQVLGAYSGSCGRA